MFKNLIVQKFDLRTVSLSAFFYLGWSLLNEVLLVYIVLVNE